MFEIIQCASEMFHDDFLQGYIVHMRGILSIWRLAVVRQALHRGRDGGDGQEAVCANRTGGFLAVAKRGET